MRRRHLRERRRFAWAGGFREIPSFIVSEPSAFGFDASLKTQPLQLLNTQMHPSREALSLRMWNGQSPHALDERGARQELLGQ